MTKLSFQSVGGIGRQKHLPKLGAARHRERNTAEGPIKQTGARNPECWPTAKDICVYFSRKEKSPHIPPSGSELLHVQLPYPSPQQVGEYTSDCE